MLSPSNIQAHRSGFQTALEELTPYSAMFSPPAPMHERFLGTCIDVTTLNIAVALTILQGAKNIGSLDLSNIDDDLFNSYAVSIHRSFYTTLLACVEMGLKHICDQKKNPIPAGIYKTMEIFEYAIKLSTLSKEDKRCWRNYYDALRILRNKSSHSDVRLNPGEEVVLKNANLDHHISDTKDVHTSVRNYKPIIDSVRTLFRNI